MDLAPILLVAIIFGGVGVAAYFALADAGAPDLPSIRLPRAVARFLRTPKGTLSAIFGALLLVAGTATGWVAVLPHLAAGLAGAGLVDLLLTRFRRGVWRWPSSALLSGAIVAFVLDPGV